MLELNAWRYLTNTDSKRSSSRLFLHALKMEKLFVSVWKVKDLFQNTWAPPACNYLVSECMTWKEIIHYTWSLEI